MLQHRLSPSGLYLNDMAWLDSGSVVTNVYKGFFPRGTVGQALVLPTVNPVTVETFSIPLPLTVPNSGDPPATFDPAKLLYLIWANIRADSDLATPGDRGASSMVTTIEVDAPGGSTVIENIMQDDTGHFTDLAGTFLGRSAVHRLINEAITEIDVLNHTPLAVFRPGSIPSWNQPATAWVAGQTRHIYVKVIGAAEVGKLLMANHRSNIIIVELYGSVTETIGVSSNTTPPRPPQ